jgi:putative hemolysin
MTRTDVGVPGRRTRPTRHRLIVFGTLGALAISACSSDDETASTTAAAVTTAPPGTTAIAATQPTQPPPPVTSPATPSTIAQVVLPDGPTLLQQAFDQLAAGYHFVSTASVNGTPAIAAEGDQIGGALRQVVTSQGKTVEYVVLPEGTWVAENGEWSELETAAPIGDPIVPLRSPLSVAVESSTPELTTLVAAFPAAAVGLPGDQPVNVTFVLAGTALTSIRYTSPDGAAVSETTISPLTDTTPITAPSA